MQTKKHELATTKMLQTKVNHTNHTVPPLIPIIQYLYQTDRPNLKKIELLRYSSPHSAQVCLLLFLLPEDTNLLPLSTVYILHFLSVTILYEARLVKGARLSGQLMAVAVPMYSMVKRNGTPNGCLRQILNPTKLGAHHTAAPEQIVPEPCLVVHC